MPETNEAIQTENNRDKIARTVATTVLISTLMITAIALLMIWNDKADTKK